MVTKSTRAAKKPTRRGQAAERTRSDAGGGFRVYALGLWTRGLGLRGLFWALELWPRPLGSGVLGFVLVGSGIHMHAVGRRFTRKWKN